MEGIVEGIPKSLYGDLYTKLVPIVLGAKDKDAVPTDMAKKIIYLWRQDQLASKTGIVTMLEAALHVDSEATYQLLDELGQQEITIALKNL